MRLTLRVRPASSRPGVRRTPEGVLVVDVAARAVEGRATEAALRAVAEALGVKPRDVRLVTGATARTKIVELPDVDDLPRRLAVLPSTRPGPDLP